MLPDWLKSVHHDGSAKYVSNLYPRLDETVRLHLRTGINAPVKRVFLRYFPDGEQSFIRMEKTGEDTACIWWAADFPIEEPVAHYRFLLEAEDGMWWLTAAGAQIQVPLDVLDFKILADYDAPMWIHDAVFYQIFPDRFANGDTSNDPHPDSYEYHGHRPKTFPWGQPPDADVNGSMIFYGGDIQGITQHLDYIEQLGINTIYLNPIFTAYSNHKYDVIDYEHVDPHLGGDDALIEFRKALDERHMRYLLDIVPNHCGYKHPWFLAAQADWQAPEAEFFTFDVHPTSYKSWLGVSSLPKLNYRSAELRRRIYEGDDSVFRRWLRPPFGADGWRVDVANMLARQGRSQMGHDISRAIRRAVKDTRPDAYLMGENFFDASPQLQGDQFDGVMNYMGFGTPLLHWLRGYRQGAWGMKEMIISPIQWATEALDLVWRERRATIPWVIALQQYNVVDSHDTERIRTIVKENDALHRLAALVQLTVPGVPGLYYGDEIGLTDLPIIGSRNCMPWNESEWNHDLLDFYRKLIKLRKDSDILKWGGWQMLIVEEDTFAYQREGVTGRMLVIAHRGATPRPADPLPVAHGGIVDGTVFREFFSGTELTVKDGNLPIGEHPQGATLWVSE